MDIAADTVMNTVMDAATDSFLSERLELVTERIRQLSMDPELPQPYGVWVRDTAAGLSACWDTDGLPLQSRDDSLLHYDEAVRIFGACGQPLCMLSAGLRLVRGWIRVREWEKAVSFSELFVMAVGEIAGALEEDAGPEIVAAILIDLIRSMYGDLLELFFEPPHALTAAAIRAFADDGDLCRLFAVGSGLSEEDLTALLTEAGVTEHCMDGALVVDKAFVQRLGEWMEACIRRGELFDVADPPNLFLGERGHEPVEHRPVYSAKQLRWVAELRERKKGEHHG